MTAEQQIENGRADAQHEHARGCAIQPAEARRRADRRRANDYPAGGCYWLAYALEIEELDGP